MRICGQLKCFAFSESRDSDSVFFRSSALKRSTATPPFPGTIRIRSVKLFSI